MSLTSSVVRTGVPLQSAVTFALAELALTSLHHAYGAFLYASPWRLEVVAISAVVAAIIVGLRVVERRHQDELAGRLAFWLNRLVMFGFPIATIGFFEGGYNHVVKNIVFFTHDSQLYAQMFPASMYEAPGDWFFEFTGVAQFPVALAALWLLVAPALSRR